jgi:hypothetical protein
MSKELRIEVKTFKIKLICDCGEELIATGTCLTSDPPQFPHRCKNGHMETIRAECYPKFVYEAD